MDWLEEFPMTDREMEGQKNSMYYFGFQPLLKEYTTRRGKKRDDAKKKLEEYFCKSIWHSNGALRSMYQAKINRLKTKLPTTDEITVPGVVKDCAKCGGNLKEFALRPETSKTKYWFILENFHFLEDVLARHLTFTAAEAT